VIVTVAAAAVCHAGPDAEFAKRRGVDDGDLALSLQRVSGGRVPTPQRDLQIQGSKSPKAESLSPFSYKRGGNS